MTAHDELVSAWEMWPAPISRWCLPVRAGARVVEIHRPADWAALVAAHPAPARADQGTWEMPGANQDLEDLSDLLAVPGQRAARTAIGRHLVPDWESVAATYDGVHLSWAGFLTAEGCVTDLGGGDVAMLRYWFSQRTHWLADAFDEPEPLGAPVLGQEGPADRRVPGGVDVRSDTRRRSRDAAVLRSLLGR